MFTAALFTIANTQKQPKCPLTKEWIKKMWYIYTMDTQLRHKKRKEGNNAIYSNKDAPRDYYTKGNK